MKRFFSLRRLVAAIATVTLAIGAFMPNVASAHGAFIEYTIYPDELVMQAVYEGGVPMAEGQIIIFAPNDPSKPWGTDKTDSEGWFSFMPDTSIEGEWAIQARQAGHGAMIHFTVGGEGSDFVVGAEPEPTATPKPEPTATATPEPKAVASAKESSDSKDSKKSEDAEKAECKCDDKPQKNDKQDCPLATAADTGDTASAAPAEESTKKAEAETAATTGEVSAEERAARRTSNANANRSSSVQSSGYTTGQRILMTGSVIWGFIATGLYFSGRRKNAAA